MKAQEIRTKKDTELVRELAETREQLRQARFELAAGRVKNIRIVQELRRTIARILTALAERKQSA